MGEQNLGAGLATGAAAVMLPSRKREPYNRSCLDVRGGQMGIVAEIEVCGSVFDLGDDELLDRLEAMAPSRVPARQSRGRARGFIVLWS